jgi:hypothetical protein
VQSTSAHVVACVTLERRDGGWFQRHPTTSPGAPAPGPNAAGLVASNGVSLLLGNN